MNYKKLRDWNSGFSRWVIHRHPENSRQQNGFMGGFIFGERGSGKSTYSYKTMAKTYYDINGYSKTDDETDAYKEAIKYIMYEPSDFRIFLIQNKLKRIVTPIICLDDASMHFGNMLHMTNPKIYAALLGETATIRTAATGFLITAPKRSHVVKFLRDYDDFKGEVKQINHGGHDPNIDSPTWQRKVRFYKWNYYPDEVKYRIQIPFQDKYSCYIPDEYYTWYLEKKRFYELKHELKIADKIDKEARTVFIELEEALPEDLRYFVEKWKKEESEIEEKDKMGKIEKQIKFDNLKKKIKKYNEERNEHEDAF